MRPRHLLLAILFVVFAASGHASTKFWTRQRVSTLTLDLQDDPAMQERLMFGPKFVLITRVTLRRVVGDEEEWITTQPAYYWKFTGDRVVIYTPGNPHDSVDTLTFVRREGDFLLLRRKSGVIARFKMSPMWAR
jgi:hypothetical protein